MDNYVYLIRRTLTDEVRGPYPHLHAAWLAANAANTAQLPEDISVWVTCAEDPESPGRVCGIDATGYPDPCAPVWPCHGRSTGAMRWRP